MLGEPINILLVEDEKAHAEIVRRNLESCRIANHIIHVEDGQAALDYLYDHGTNKNTGEKPRPHLILLDLRLPKVDGMEVLRRIKADGALRSLPVVILTSSQRESDLSGAYANCANSYLVKPVDFEKFSTLLETFGFYWLAWNRYPR
ncbi:MAG TPA: response regulator [Phycisphaerae bacterium]|nr:response regulator [Phycisphaerae bacterium]